MEKAVVDFSLLPEEVLEEYDIEVYSSYEDVFWSLFLDVQEFTINDAVELLKHDTMQEVVEAQPYMYKFGDKYYRWTEFSYMDELAEKYPHAIVSEMDDAFKTETIQLDKLSGDYFAVANAIQKAYRENDVELASHFATSRAPDLSIEDVVRLYADLKGEIDGDKVFEFKEETGEVKALWSLDEPFLNDNEIKGLFDDFAPIQPENVRAASLRSALSDMRHEVNGAAEFAPDLLPLKEKQYAILDVQHDAALNGVEVDLPVDNIIDLEHLDCFWYDGYIGSLSYKGYTISVEAHGDIGIDILSEDLKANIASFRNPSTDDVYPYFKNDNELQQMSESGRLVWQNNNWLEFVVFDKEGNEVDVPLADNVLDNNVLDAFYDVKYYKDLIDEIDQRWRPYSLTKETCDKHVDTMVSTIRGKGIASGSGYYGLKNFEINGEKLNLFCEVSKEQEEGDLYYSVYYAVEFDEGDTIFSDWAHTETMDIEELKKVIYEIASADYSQAVKDYLGIEARQTPSFENALVFEDDIYLDDDYERLSGYLWAVDGLVDRLSSAESMDNINFYADYAVRTGEVELISTYYTLVDGAEVQKVVSLPLTDEEKAMLVNGLEGYCQQEYKQSCLEYINEARDANRLPLIETSSKSSLAVQIESAEGKKIEEVAAERTKDTIER